MRRGSRYFGVMLLLLVAGCGKFHKIEKSEDWRVKYEAGLNYYDKKDYYHASLLFEQILPIVRGLPEGDQVQFKLAYCQYYNKYFLLAAEQFKSFYEIYGRSTLAEEARYMQAYALYQSSPGFELDQSASIQAMANMQTFLNRYPNSKFRDEATSVIETIQQRLEKKGFENARQYVKLRKYKAAIIALDNFVNHFPDSKYVEEAQFLAIQSRFALAEQSVLSKQRDRYEEVISTYKDFIDNYPNSGFLRDAERYYLESLDKTQNKLNNS